MTIAIYHWRWELLIQFDRIWFLYFSFITYRAYFVMAQSSSGARLSGPSRGPRVATGTSVWGRWEIGGTLGGGAGGNGHRNTSEYIRYVESVGTLRIKQVHRRNYWCHHWYISIGMSCKYIVLLYLAVRAWWKRCKAWWRPVVLNLGCAMEARLGNGRPGCPCRTKARWKSQAEEVEESLRRRYRYQRYQCAAIHRTWWR